MYVSSEIDAQLRYEYGCDLRRLYPWPGVCDPVYWGAALASIRSGDATTWDQHDELETFIIISGEGRMEIDDTVRPVAAGDVVLIPRHSKHRICNTSAGETLKFLSVFWDSPLARDRMRRALDAPLSAGRADLEGSTPRHLIAAPPPTPNGGLHLGHLSGPYLAADVFRRESLACGHEAVMAISTDDHQVYVDLAADRFELSAQSLIARSRRDIAETLVRFGLGDRELAQSGPEYNAFVGDFFSDALERGLIELGDCEVAWDDRAGRALEGPEVTGACPACFAEATGGICEACGDPNQGWDLLEIPGGPTLSSRTQPCLLIDLERYRAELSAWFNELEIASAPLRNKLAGWTAGPLGRFALSSPAPRGVPAPASAPTGHRINVWAEMYPGHILHMEQAAGGFRPDDRYVQFLGFDNSYYYTILHGALAAVAQRCGRDWPKPRALIVNRFYNLGFEKFSTSRNVAVWANEFADRFNTDLIRFWLALHGPQHDEASFNLQDAEARIANLGDLINRISAAFNARLPVADKAVAPQFAAPFRSGAAAGLSMRDLAVRALNQLEFLDRAIQAGDLSLLPQAPLVMRQCLRSLCPQLCARITLQPGARMPLLEPDKHFQAEAAS